MKSIFTYGLLVISVCVNASTIKPLVNEDSNNSIWAGEPNYRPTYFILPIYKAIILDNNSIEIMDGPIILENSRAGMYFVVTSDNYEDYEIHPMETNSTDNVQIQLNVTSMEPIGREFDVVILEALDENLVPVTRTTILIFNSNNDLDMYKMKFKIDDSEYIVLNYFYFKWFLGLLTATGLLILIIELHEIVKNVRIARNNSRSRQNVKYQELLHI